MSIRENLEELGIELPEAPKPVASYIPAVRTGNLVFISGQLPLKDGKLLYQGKLGEEVSLEEGYEAARVCAVNALSVLLAEIGSLDQVKRFVQVVGYVQCRDDFHDQPRVVNGASELLGKVFGDKGQHSRVAVGVNSLPLNSPVEVSMIVEVED